MKLTDEAITEAYKAWLKSGAGYIEYARAIESAITPPVAAGSVDTAEYISALQATVTEQSKRAEKAEAEMAATKQALVYEQRHAAESEVALAAEHTALLKAEARAKELEAALAKAYPNAIDPSDTPC